MVVTTYVLILFMATSSYTDAGAAVAIVEFHGERACLKASEALTAAAVKSKSRVFAGGCFPKNEVKP